MTMRVLGTMLALARRCSSHARARALPAHPADTVLVENAHSGGHYAATNTTSAGGGIYEDVPLNTSAGQVVCASAWLRTQLPATGAAGKFTLWLTGKTGDQWRGHRLWRPRQPRQLDPGPDLRGGQRRPHHAAHPGLSHPGIAHD